MLKKTSYSDFIDQINGKKIMAETCFYFSDDPWKKTYLLICHRMMIQPILIRAGLRKEYRFNTAEEMGEAKIFHGKSLKEKWDQVVLFPIP